MSSLSEALQLHQAGRRAEAEAIYRVVLARQPDNADALHLLGMLAHEEGRHQAAVEHIRRAIALGPRVSFYHSNLGNALQALGRLEEAITCYRRALELEPDLAEAHQNLGNLYRRQERNEEAIACYRQALACRPDAPHVHLALAHTLLLTGRFEEGWEEFEWRWRLGGVTDRPFPQPLWDGWPIQGRRILLWAEQGFGDTLQFVRYAALVKERGATVLLECQPELARLLAAAEGVDEAIPFGAPLPPFDVHVPLQSLPRIFRTTLATIPSSRIGLPPCLSSGTGKTGLEAYPTRIGLAWAGNPRQASDRARSIPPAELAPLAHIPGLTWFSLQKNPGALPPLPLTDLAPGFRDFADTAAAVRDLDLIISADTAVAHLAGALAKPVWVMLSAPPDYRWLVARADSPWYPTMRLFRQPRPGDWGAVVREVAIALSALASGTENQKAKGKRQKAKMKTGRGANRPAGLSCFPGAAGARNPRGAPGGRSGPILPAAVDKEPGCE